MQEVFDAHVVVRSLLWESLLLMDPMSGFIPSNAWDCWREPMLYQLLEYLQLFGPI